MQDINIKIFTEKIKKRVESKSFILYYVLYGKCDIYSNRGYRLEDEEFVLINSNEQHTINTAGQALVISIEFGFQLIIDLTRNPMIKFSDLSKEQKTENGEQLRLDIKKLLSVHTYNNYADVIKKQQYYFELLMLLLDHFVLQSDDENNLSVDNRSLAILEYVQMNYKKEISLQDLAEKLFLSVPYLSKYIKQTMGMGFVEYVNEVRLSHAVEELVKTDLSLTKIAFNNGFSNLSSLNRVFKQAYGKMPSEYKKEYKKQEKITEQEEKQLIDKVKEYLAKNPVQESVQLKKKLSYKMKVQQNKSYTKIWNHFYSIGNAEELLNSVVQEHVLYMKKELNMKRVGIWSLFVKKMLIDMNSDYYNFNRIDYVLDFLIEHDLKPVIELTEHPKELYNGSDSALLYEKSEFELNSIDRYERFLKSFIKHCIERYGIDEVSKWEFEQGWDEHIPVADAEICFMNLFKTAWATIKQYLPNTKIGGGALFLFDNGERVEEVLSKWKESAYKPDFLSFWLFPYDLLEEGEPRKFRISNDPYYLSKKMKQARRIMDKYGMEEIPLYVSRWNMSLTCRNLLNDSCYKGAYIIRTLIECIGKADAIAYYGSTDLLYEYLDSVKTITGGYGLVSKDGIKKSSYYAFKFMGQLGDYLIQKDENYIVTTNNLDSYFIVCQNCGRLNMDYIFRKEYEHAYDRHTSENELILDFCLQGVKNGKYQMKTYFINQNVGGVLEEWMRLGYPDISDREEIEYLKSVCVPHQVSSNTSVSDGNLYHQTVLGLNEIQFIRIKYIMD